METPGKSRLVGTGSMQTESGRVLALTLVILLCLPAGLSAMSRKGPVHNSHPVVGEVMGKVTVKGRGQSAWEPVERGTLLLSGDVIRSGASGRARIRFASGTMELYENSEIHIPTTGIHERKKDIRDLVVREGRVFLDISMTGEEGRFRFSTGNTRGKVTGSTMTVSYLGEGTAVNVYRGEAQVSHLEGQVERTSSLVPGSSLSVRDPESLARISQFDPEPAVKKYRKKISPVLDVASGLPAVDKDVSGSDEREQVWASRDGNGRDDGIVNRDTKPGDTVSGIDGDGISVTSPGETVSGIQEKETSFAEPDIGTVRDQAVNSVDKIISGHEVNQ